MDANQMDKGIPSPKNFATHNVEQIYQGNESMSSASNVTCMKSGFIECMFSKLPNLLKKGACGHPLAG